MKRLVPTLLCVLFIASIVNAGPIQERQKAILSMWAAAGETCELISSPQTTGANATAHLGETDIQYLHSAFVAEANATVRTVVLQMSTDNNSPTENVVVALCTSSGGAPNVCTNADSVMSSPGVAGYKYLRWADGYAITNGTTYHIRLYTAENSGTNYYKVNYNSGVSSYVVRRSADGSSWANYAGDSSARIVFELSECVTYTH